MTHASGRLAAVLVVSLVSFGAGLAAQQSTPVQNEDNRSASYLNLEPRRRMPQPALLGAAQPARPSDAASQEAPTAPGRRVVCGTTIFSGDVAVDPGIQVPPMPRLVTPTIRTVEPPICWDRSQQK